MNILVTGGAGFIGSNFVRYMLDLYPTYKIINYDALTYAGNLENLKGYEDYPNYSFVKGDIQNQELLQHVITMHGIEAMINFSAESHVDRSIANPSVFIKTNIVGTQVLLDVAKDNKIHKYIQISTDEVYGSLGKEGYFTEETSLAPNSPYSASKASGDLLVKSYYETFNLNVNITRCSNNYGPFHFPEKLIPLMITNALEDKNLPIYGDGLNIRDWLHVRDHCEAIDLVLHKGLPGEVYNIGGNNEKSNIEVVREILSALNKSEALIQYVNDRAGHDKRYAIDATKIKNELGWSPRYDFETGLSQTVEWYLGNTEWWKRIKKGEYLKYYKQQYGASL